MITINGYFNKQLWHDETGKSIFSFFTDRQDLPEGEKRVRRAGKIWNTFVALATKVTVPPMADSMPIRMKGEVIESKKGKTGYSFEIKSVLIGPYDQRSLEVFLRGKAFEEVSPETAKTIAEYCGDDFMSKSSEDDICYIANNTDIQYSSVAHIFDILHRIQAEQDLYCFLRPFYTPYHVVAKVVEVYGAKAMDELKAHPHRVGKQAGLLFAQRDNLAESFGIPYDTRERVQDVAIEAASYLQNSGDTWFTTKDFSAACARVLEHGAYQDFPTDFDIFPYLPTFLQMEGDRIINTYLRTIERRIANNVDRIACGVQPKFGDIIGPAMVEETEKACGITYGEEQKDAFIKLMYSGGIRVLTGGPGTGKTTLIKGLLYAFEWENPKCKIKLCAPTGRAAQRMSESTGREATTIHRLLNYQPWGGDRAQVKDQNDPIKADLIVCDEASMINIELFDMLLSAIKTGTILVIVGDSDQLEAVGAGAVLYDLLQAGERTVQAACLTEVYRQAGDSSIVANAYRINKGDTNLLKDKYFHVWNVESPDRAKEYIEYAMQKGYKKNDPFGTQLLCPVKKSQYGVYKANEVLQELLNPQDEDHAVHYGSTEYRLDDKILMTVNNYQGVAYYNGDIGIIEGIEDDGGINVKIRGQDMHLKRSDMKNMQHAYCMTVHKSQGSEFKNVIIYIPKEAKGLLTRNMFYTAVTRAKNLVIIINEDGAMEKAILNERNGKRHTHLGTFLQDFKKRNEKAALDPVTEKGEATIFDITRYFGEYDGAVVCE